MKKYSGIAETAVMFILERKLWKNALHVNILKLILKFNL
jgi:hypothetical protein